MMPNSGLPFALPDPPRRDEVLEAGAVLLGGYAAGNAGTDLIEAVLRVAEKAPFRQMITPGGWTMSVAMTNSGQVGWVTSRKGYRYAAQDPETGLPWPAMPTSLQTLALEAAAAGGFAGFVPDACLINRYAPGTRLTLHQDINERDFSQPVVSVSLGLPAVFLWGGAKRTDKPRRIPLYHGDVVVWGGPARKHFHGIHPLADGMHPLTGSFRYNLTFRRAL